MPHCPRCFVFFKLTAFRWTDVGCLPISFRVSVTTIWMQAGPHPPYATTMLADWSTSTCRWVSAKRCNSSVSALELHLSCTKPSICTHHINRDWLIPTLMIQTFFSLSSPSLSSLSPFLSPSLSPSPFDTKWGGTGVLPVLLIFISKCPKTSKFPSVCLPRVLLSERYVINDVYNIGDFSETTFKLHLTKYFSLIANYSDL